MSDFFNMLPVKFNLLSNCMLENVRLMENQSKVKTLANLKYDLFLGLLYF